MLKLFNLCSVSRVKQFWKEQKNSVFSWLKAPQERSLLISDAVCIHPEVKDFNDLREGCIVCRSFHCYLYRNNSLQGTMISSLPNLDFEPKQVRKTTRSVTYLLDATHLHWMLSTIVDEHLEKLNLPFKTNFLAVGWCSGFTRIVYLEALTFSECLELYSDKETKNFIQTQLIELVSLLIKNLDSLDICLDVVKNDPFRFRREKIKIGKLDFDFSVHLFDYSSCCLSSGKVRLVWTSKLVDLDLPEKFSKETNLKPYIGNMYRMMVSGQKLQFNSQLIRLFWLKRYGLGSLVKSF